MKVLVIGANGTIGKKAVKQLQKKHSIVTAGRNSGDYRLDISEKNSIKSLFEKAGKFDAILCIAGEAKWAPFKDLSEQDFYIGIKSKLMGQINLVRIGIPYLNPGGSITLSTGVLADHPVPMTTSAAMVNGALHSFVKALKHDLDPAYRVNIVSLGLVEDSAEKYKDYFKGHKVIEMNRVVHAYEKSLDENLRGEIIRIYE